MSNANKITGIYIAVGYNPNSLKIIENILKDINKIQSSNNKKPIINDTDYKYHTTISYFKFPTNYKELLYELYLRRTDRINNWDLVDTSCRDVVGGYLMDKPRDILYQLAESSDLWERRIAIVSTWEFIRHGDLDDTFRLSKALKNDKQDLIHKASGWMLREAGKKDVNRLVEFLDENATTMPRTMLRYSIEKLPEAQGRYYLGLS